MDKRRLTTALAKYLFNPLVRTLFRLGLPAPGTAILETVGRKSGQPRRTPVTNGRDGDVFWIVTEHGRRANYVRNIEANPRVLMDVRMPVLDGLEATRSILSGDTRTRIIILTTFDLDEYVFEALRAGASGFLLKNAPPERLIEAVAVVARGEGLLDPAITRGVIERFAGTSAPPPADLDRLTAREREVWALVARGLTNSEIADALVVSIGTVKAHVASVLAKLGCRDRTQAVVYAYELGIVRPGEASL